MKKILPALTTITPSLWESKVKEIDELGIKEIALFPTCLDRSSRQKLYKQLQKTGLGSIPFAHLRTDMDAEELNFLSENYGCKVFNIHADEGAPDFLKRAKKYTDKIYVENGIDYLLNEYYWEITDLSAGICVDFSHLYDYKILQKNRNYQKFAERLSYYKVGCGHISAIKGKSRCSAEKEGNKKEHYSVHIMEDISEIEYMKEFTNLVPDVCAIELENSLEEQLRIKDYLESIL
jgi:hypothetical protein